MSTIPSDDVTVISLIVSLVSLVLVIVFSVLLKRGLRDFKSSASSIDAYALLEEFRVRTRNLEERLVDQKVRLEILELRLSRQKPAGEATTNYMVGVRSQSLSPAVEYPSSLRTGFRLRETPAGERKLGVSKDIPSEETADIKGPPGIQEAILRFILESQDVKTAKEIQLKIGRSREHTARMMNALYKQGLVNRNGVERPFTYSITERGKEAVLLLIHPPSRKGEEEV